MQPVVNDTGYAYYGPNHDVLIRGTPTMRPRLTFEVTFILDMVPGAFHHPEDLANWIASNPYVDTVTLKEV